MSERYKLDAPRYVGLINMGGDYCGHGLASEYPDEFEDEYTTSRASDQEWIKSQDYDALAAMVIEQQAEIERLRGIVRELIEMLDYDRTSERYRVPVDAAYSEIDQ